MFCSLQQFTLNPVGSLMPWVKIYTNNNKSASLQCKGSLLSSCRILTRWHYYCYYLFWLLLLLLLLLLTSDWLLPITTCGLRLHDEAVRVAVGLRLRVNICEPHECRCGTMVKANGSHGLSCSLGPGRTARHANLNELICRSLSLSRLICRNPRA